jgi:hypothetical protein
MLVTLLAVAMVTVVQGTVRLVLGLTALRRCQKKDIPAVMEALAAVLKAPTRWGRG